MDKNTADAIVALSGFCLVLTLVVKRDSSQPSWFSNWLSRADAMSITLWSIVGALVVFSLVLFQLNASAGTNGGGQPIAWKTYHSRFGFSVSMPGDVSEDSTSQEALGQTITAYRAMSKDVARDCSFLALYHGPVPGLTFTAQAVADQLTQTGDLLSCRGINVDGHYGQEAVLQTSDRHRLTARIFTDNGSVITILVSASNRYADDADIQSFVSTMHFDANAPLQ